jgi:hypothetical protein
MTGQAPAGNQLRFRICAVLEPLRALQRAGMSTHHVALLAQKWHRCDQQRQLIRAVREMTIEAVLAHRLIDILAMLPSTENFDIGLWQSLQERPLR